MTTLMLMFDIIFGVFAILILAIAITIVVVSSRVIAGAAELKAHWEANAERKEKPH